MNPFQGRYFSAMDNFVLNQVQLKTELPFSSVKSTVSLLHEAATVPFIARYRQEMTGGMDETQIRSIQTWLTYYENLQDRKQTILATIKEQNKLTPELEKQIIACTEAAMLEEIYLPYKPKRKTKASVAIENGLEPLAEMIFKNEPVGNKEALLAKFLNDTIKTIEEAIEGAQYIVAERFSVDLEIREFVRQQFLKYGVLECKKRRQTEEHKDTMKFELYFEFNGKVDQLKPHQVLALNRGEKLNILNIGISVEEEFCTTFIERRLRINSRGIFTEELKGAIVLALRRYIFPSIELELRNNLTEKADKHAISTFSTNLYNLLMQAPIVDKVVLGIDPGFVSGCKVAVVDGNGNYLEGDVIYPVPPKNDFAGAERILMHLIEKHKVDIIAIGNGTASRETETFVAGFLRKQQLPTQFIIVNEAGASVYSASEVAKQEFPKLDATQRGNISIARRLQDPLAELVKIDPKSIGVGLYQHDVDQKALADELGAVVESAVNHVGVDLNTASASLLSYVSGLSARQANEVIEYRKKIKRFRSRVQLKEVPGIGDKSYEQCAGFLKIRGGEEPLDNTTIHPESYPALEKIAAYFGLKRDQFKELSLKMSFAQAKDDAAIMTQAGIGKPTLQLIKENLAKPGRDPREALQKPLLRSDILKIDDLREGMELTGTIRNVVDFGAFVDIGLKNDALIHISKMGNRFVKNPHEVVAVGEIVRVQVEKIEAQKQRVGLSLVV